MGVVRFVLTISAHISVAVTLVIVLIPIDIAVMVREIELLIR